MPAKDQTGSSQIAHFATSLLLHHPQRGRIQNEFSRKPIQKEENTMGGDTNTFYSDEVTKVQRVGESLAVHSHLSKYQSRFMKYFRILIFDLQRDIFTR